MSKNLCPSDLGLTQSSPLTCRPRADVGFEDCSADAGMFAINHTSGPNPRIHNFSQRDFGLNPELIQRWLAQLWIENDESQISVVSQRNSMLARRRFHNMQIWFSLLFAVIVVGGCSQNPVADSGDGEGGTTPSTGIATKDETTASDSNNKEKLVALDIQRNIAEWILSVNGRLMLRGVISG